MAIHEEINDKSLILAARVSRITAAELRRAAAKLLADLSARRGRTKLAKTQELRRGKQTLKQLSAHNAGLSSIELKDPNLRLLHREMKRDGVDFAAVKDGNGRYTLFFKGRDADALTHAFGRYTSKLTSRATAKRPPINADLSAAKETVKTLNAERDRVKKLDKGARGL